MKKNIIILVFIALGFYIILSYAKNKDAPAEAPLSPYEIKRQQQGLPVR